MNWSFIASSPTDEQSYRIERTFKNKNPFSAFESSWFKQWWDTARWNVRTDHSVL